MQERPLEAITQYRAALVRAEAREDLPAIADFSYDIAVAQFQAGQPAAALDTVAMLRAELWRPAPILRCCTLRSRMLAHTNDTGS
ncbi:MAG: hypothetical protein JO110_14085 [Acetobacteraceae bacterium]|nr:hypothetical protein [Acetobacteraceae bacterium]